jgi:hypothetical protein
LKGGLTTKKKVEKQVDIEGLKIAKKVEVEIQMKSLSIARKAVLLGDSPKLQEWFHGVEQVRKNPEILKHIGKKPVDLGELTLKEVKTKGENKEDGQED